MVEKTTVRMSESQVSRVRESAAYTSPSEALRAAARRIIENPDEVTPRDLPDGEGSERVTVRADSEFFAAVDEAVEEHPAGTRSSLLRGAVAQVLDDNELPASSSGADADNGGGLQL